MKRLLWLHALTILSVGSFAQSFKSIFNGKDLTGCTNNGTEKWYIENKELVCENGPDKQYGYLSTTKNYKNFELTLQFRQEANGNSGVFIRSTIEGTKINGWQVEVAQENIAHRRYLWKLRTWLADTTKTRRGKMVANGQME